MTQKEVEILKKSFLDSLETYVNARLQNLDFVKTQIGVVTDVTLNTDDNRYYHTVACNVTSATSGVTYENIVSLDNTQYGVNSIVFLLAPNAQFTNQFILGGLDPLPSETINYGDLQGKPSINGVTLLGNKTTADLHITASIDYGTTIPTGGSNGDVYFQNDGTNVIAIWQKVSGTWIDLTGNNSSIDYGINDPTGGEDGDTYIQVAPPYVNANLQYGNASTWVFDGFSDNNRTLTMHGTASNQWEYVYFYLQGLTVNTQYTLLFDAKFSDNTTFYNGGWVLGMCVNGTFNPVNYESQITNQAYVPFKRDTNKNSYTLTFTATSSSMYLWVQPTDVTDGVSSTLVISNFAVTTSGEREGIKALWINSSGTWQKGEFDNKDFTGATASTDGIHGLVPAPVASNTLKYLCSDGTWKSINTTDTRGGTLVTLLYDGKMDSTTTTYTLEDSIDNYDMVLVCGYNYANTSTGTAYRQNQYQSILIMKEDYYLESKSDTGDGKWAHMIGGYTDRRIVFTFTSNTTVIVDGRNYGVINKIYGIKINQQNENVIPLFETTTNHVSNITMSNDESMLDYDAILLQASVNTSDRIDITTFYLTDSNLFGDGRRIGVTSETSYVWYEISNSGKTLTFVSRNSNNFFISGVYGLILNNVHGGGGSSAEVFTGATATTDGTEGLVPAPLAGDENKYLCGDGTWKHINYKDGTTNGYKRTNLFTSDTVVYNTTINLSDHMLNYDIIEIVYGFASTDKTHETMWIDAEYFVNNFPYVNTTSNTHNHILLSPYDNGYTRVTLGQGGDNTLCSYLTNNYNVTGIYEVNGITLGNKYTKTLLWDYQNDNSGVIPFNTYIKTLNEDINNYDVLLVELVSSKSDLTNVNWNSTIQWQINIDSLNNSYNSNYITFTTFGDRASRYYIKDTTFQCATCNITDTNGLVRVYGILYGNDKNKRGKELIYTGTSRANTITIDDNKSMYDYDAILLQGTVTTSSGTFENTMFYITSDTEFVDGKQIGINDDASYLWYTIGDNGTTLTFLGSAGYAYYISSIYGINFNAGGGSGEIPTTETPQIPIMISNTSPSGVASASSILGANFDAYMAFNGQSANLQTMNGGWLASNSDSAPWLKYHFDSAVKFDSIKIETANNSTATSKVIYIEGSNDGVTWENVLLNSESVTLIFALREYTNYTFNLNGESYTYLRLRGVEPFYNGTNQYACTFSKVQLYTIESDLNYNILSNKPQINGVDLIGNKTTSQLIPIDSSLTINNNGELGVANSNNIDQLYTSSIIAPIINLSNNVSMYDYDCILIQSTVINDSGTFENTTYYITSDSKFIDGYNIGVTDNINYLWYTIGNSGSRLTLIPDTQLVNTPSYQIYISAIYGINIKGGNSNNHSYSLSEKIVDTWIDGRPIYEITFIIDGGLNFNNTSETIPTSVFDWNTHNVDLFISGMALRYNTSSYKAGCTLASPWISNNDFKITINGTWNALTHFTIRYTKTTD